MVIPNCAPQGDKGHPKKSSIPISRCPQINLALDPVIWVTLRRKPKSVVLRRELIAASSGYVEGFRLSEKLGPGDPSVSGVLQFRQTRSRPGQGLDKVKIPSF